MIIDPYTWHRVKIATVMTVATDTVAIRMPRPDGYTFRAGQYAVVRTVIENTPLIRQYSFSSNPDDDMFELLVQCEPGGTVSNWFYTSAKPGDEIKLSQPFGNFTWDNEPGPILLIAGRIGIAPFVSMLRHHQKVRSRAPVSILYSVRDAKQICEKDLLDSYETTYLITGSGQRLSKELLQVHLGKNPTVYLCGSKQFVDALNTLLLSLQVSQDRIRRELFTLQ